MPIVVGPLDPEGIHPSPYRGVTRISTPTPSSQKYVAYNADGEWMGEVRWSVRYVTPEFERAVAALQALCDPVEDPVVKPNLKLA